mgnify:CR=1 FL=1
MKDTKKPAPPNRRAHQRDREPITKRPISKPTDAEKGAQPRQIAENTTSEEDE